MTELNLPERIFARGEEPAGERVNTYHKPKRIESILEALDPEEGSFGQYVIVRRLREFAFVTGLKCGRIPICLKRKVARSRSFQCYKSQTMGETDFGWDDEVEDDLVDNM
ncbi:hypothetical protein HID58_064532, partial [Brassica napus]